MNTCPGSGRPRVHTTTDGYTPCPVCMRDVPSLRHDVVVPQHVALPGVSRFEREGRECPDCTSRTNWVRLTGERRCAHCGQNIRNGDERARNEQRRAAVAFWRTDPASRARTSEGPTMHACDELATAALEAVDLHALTAAEVYDLAADYLEGPP